MEEKCIIIFKYFEIQLFYLTAICSLFDKNSMAAKNFSKK